MKCPYCNAKIEDDALFCENCGKKIEPYRDSGSSQISYIYCEQCGAKNRSDALYCTSCQAPLQDDISQTYGRQTSYQEGAPQAYGRQTSYQEDTSRTYGRQASYQEDTSRAYGRQASYQENNSGLYGRQTSGGRNVSAGKPYSSRKTSSSSTGAVFKIIIPVCLAAVLIVVGVIAVPKLIGNKRNSVANSSDEEMTTGNTTTAGSESSSEIAENDTASETENETKKSSSSAIDLSSEQTLQAKGTISVQDTQYYLSLSSPIDIKTSADSNETTTVSGFYLSQGSYNLEEYKGQSATITGKANYVDGKVQMTISDNGLVVNGEQVAANGTSATESEESTSEQTASSGYTLDGSLFADGQARTSTSGYILPESATKYLAESDVSHLSLKGLCYAKNEIYARHGRKFNSAELTTYFMNTTWYDGTIEPENFTETTLQSLFNDYEKINATFLSNLESSKGTYQLDQ